MYGNHPMGTTTKREVNASRGTRLRWQERTRVKGRKFPVTVTRIAV